jgi:hypothetical protein
MRSSAMAVCTMQSGLSARSASMSLVPATPRVLAQPGQLAGIAADLVGLETKSPTSSSSGWASMPARA